MCSFSSGARTASPQLGRTDIDWRLYIGSRGRHSGVEREADHAEKESARRPFTLDRTTSRTKNGYGKDIGVLVNLRCAGNMGASALLPTIVSIGRCRVCGAFVGRSFSSTNT